MATTARKSSKRVGARSWRRVNFRIRSVEAPFGRASSVSETSDICNVALEDKQGQVAPLRADPSARVRPNA